MIKLSDYLDTPTMGEIVSNAKPAKRTFQAAKISRLNSDWTTSPTTANYELRNSLRQLRARARQMARDDSHFKKFLTMARSNIIGPKGIQLQVRARSAEGVLNTPLNKRVEESFKEWCFKENCTASGKLDFLAAQNLFVTQLARDGECLVQKVKADNAFGFALKFIDVSYLDETYNSEGANGSRILMSVEVDRNDKPVAYYLTTPTADYSLPGERRARVRVPASEIIHAFLVYDDETQVRGVTWFHSALVDAKNLHGYKDGVITSARAAACSFGMLKPPVGEDLFDDDDDAPTVEIDVHPLSIHELPPGYEFEQFDPKQPTQNHPQFYKSMLMDLAVGLDVFYFSLAGDMEAVNYSSARVGLNEERDIWRTLQAFVAQNFCREIFSEWARSAWTSGKLKLTAKEYVAIQNPVWRARGWEYVDPGKEVQANIDALANNLTTWTDVLAEQGKDLIEHLETRQNEQKLAAKYGVELSVAVKMNPAANPSDSSASDDPDAANQDDSNQ